MVEDLHERKKTVDSIIENARVWYSEHSDHVDRLMSVTDKSYAPGGSDRVRPELWTGSHWRWFLKVINAG